MMSGPECKKERAEESNSAYKQRITKQRQRHLKLAKKQHSNKSKTNASVIFSFLLVNPTTSKRFGVVIYLLHTYINFINVSFSPKETPLY